MPLVGTVFVLEDAEYRQVRVLDELEAIGQIGSVVRPATGIDGQVPLIAALFRSDGAPEQRQVPVTGGLQAVRWIDWPGQLAVGIAIPDRIS